MTKGIAALTGLLTYFFIQSIGYELVAHSCANVYYTPHSRTGFLFRGSLDPHVFLHQPSAVQQGSRGQDGLVR